MSYHMTVPSETPPKGAGSTVRGIPGAPRHRALQASRKNHVGLNWYFRFYMVFAGKSI